MRDYHPREVKFGAFLWAMFPLQFIIYNIIPYMTIICFHWYNSQQHSLDNENMSRDDREVEWRAEQENGYMRNS